VRDTGLEKFLEGAKLAVRPSPVSAQEPSTVCVEEGTLEALRVYLAAGNGADGKGLGGVDVEVDALLKDFLVYVASLMPGECFFFLGCSFVFVHSSLFLFVHSCLCILI